MIDWETLGNRTERAILERGLSSEWVAAKAGLDRKTVVRLRKGLPVRPTSLKCISEVLDLRVGEVTSSGNETVKEAALNTAPESLGGYQKSFFEAYAGHYYLFRNSFDYDDRIICSLFEIFWDEAAGHLKWRDLQDNKRDDGKRFTYTFEGPVAIPPGTSITQFIYDAGKGFTRLVTATNLRSGPPPHFKGIILGINEDSRFGYYPSTSPVYIEKCQHQPEMRETGRRVGSHLKDDCWNDSARAELREISRSYGSFSKRAFFDE